MSSQLYAMLIVLSTSIASIASIALVSFSQTYRDYDYRELNFFFENRKIVN